MRKAYYFVSGSIYTRTLSSITDTYKDYEAREVKDDLLMALVNEYDNLNMQMETAEKRWDKIFRNFDKDNSTEQQINEFIEAHETFLELKKLTFEKYDKMLERYDDVIIFPLMPKAAVQELFAKRK